MSAWTPDELLKAQLDLRKRTKDCTPGIYGIVREGVCRLHGTGSFLSIHERLFLLSAAHVLEKDDEYQYLGHYAGPGKPPTKLCTLDRKIDHENDVSVHELPLDAIINTGLSAASVNVVMGDDSQLHSPWFLQGYPGKQSVPFDVNSLKNTTISLLTGPVETERQIDGSLCFHYDESNNHSSPGLSVEAPYPAGLSGSALWQWPEGDLLPESARIIGVACVYHEETKMISAAPPKVIQSLLQQFALNI